MVIDIIVVTVFVLISACCFLEGIRAIRRNGLPHETVEATVASTSRDFLERRQGKWLYVDLVYAHKGCSHTLSRHMKAAEDGGPHVGDPMPVEVYSDTGKEYAAATDGYMYIIMGIVVLVFLAIAWVRSH